MRPNTPTAARARGFSLVEVLVGVTIGLIGCIIIFQVFAVHEGYKRSTTSGADAQVAGALGLYAVERDLKLAGYGLHDRIAFGCNMVAYTSTRSTTSYSLRFAPAQIHAGATAADSDIIGVNYGTPLDFGPGYGLTAANMAPGNNFRMENRAGLRFFDFLLVYQPSQTTCALVNAVNLPLESPPGGGSAAVPACGGSNTTDAVEICAGTAKTDADGVARIYNPAGGVAGAPTYSVSATTANSRFYNLGAEPTFNVYRVLNNNLSVCNMRTANCASTTAANWQTIMENVVFLKARYGIDTNDDGIVDSYYSDAAGFSDGRICRETAAYTSAAGDNFGDSWAVPSDTNADGLHDTWAGGTPNGYDWSRVLAVRLAIVVRSAQFEKEDVSPATIKLWPDGTSSTGACDGTGALTGAAEVGPVYTVPDRKYRYRVFETIVPLRNALWAPE